MVFILRRGPGYLDNVVVSRTLQQLCCGPCACNLFLRRQVPSSYVSTWLLLIWCLTSTWNQWNVVLHIWTYMIWNAILSTLSFDLNLKHKKGENCIWNKVIQNVKHNLTLPKKVVKQRTAYNSYYDFDFVVGWNCQYSTHCGLVTSYGTIGLGSTLVQVMLDGFKSLPEPMLTNHHQCLVAFICRQFQCKCSIYLSLIWDWKFLIYDYRHISQELI